MYRFHFFIYRVSLKLYKFKFSKIISLFLINRLSFFIKVNKKRVLFGAMNGRYYGDNSKYVYEWILENRTDLSPIWITTSKDVFRMLAIKDFPVAYAFSIKGLYMLLSAPVALFTNSLRDIAIDPFCVPDRLKLISLRHGRSVKRVRFARIDHKISNFENFERLRESSLISRVISTSSFISNIQEECLQLGIDKHIVTGYPRNDKLLEPDESDKEVFERFVSDVDFDRVVLYAPTWRHGRDSVDFFPFNDFELESLIQILEKEKTLLLIRPHVGDLRYKKLNDFLGSLNIASKYIKISNHIVFPDVNVIIPFVDALICDYSALYHDFLILNKPMIFIPYDYDSFLKENGFLYDYFKYLPGPSVLNFNDFKTELNNITKDIDLFYDKRTYLKKLIHEFDDRKSTKRVVSLVDSLLGEDNE